LKKCRNDSDDVLIPLKTKGQKAPLFCVPGGSGNSLYFQPFSTALGQHHPVYGIQAVGLDGECAPLTSVESMARENIKAMRRVQKHGPWYLLGHCFGAIVAYEMAKQLVDMGEEIGRLFVVDAPAPFPEHRPPCINWSQSRWLRYFVTVMEESTGLTAQFDEDQFAACDFNAQLQLCKEFMENAGVLPGDSNINQVMGLVNVFKNNSQTLYQPVITQRIPITVVRATEAHPVYDYSAADDHHDLRFSSLSWKKAADSSLEIKCVPGNHISMLIEPNVQSLADAIELSLSQSTSQKHAFNAEALIQGSSTTNEHSVSQVLDTALVN
jgi:thioesterase domain-containing protein